MELYKEDQLKVFKEMKEWVLAQGFKSDYQLSQSDTFIMQICKSRKFDIKKAQEFYKVVYKNRLQQNFQKISKHQFENEEKVARWLAYKSVWKSGFHGQSKAGIPIWYDILSEWETSHNYVNIFSDKEILGQQVFENYRAFKQIQPKMSEIFGHTIRQTITIIDMANFGQYHSVGGNEKATIGHITNFASNSQPENLFRTVICNSPFLFRGFWSVIKQLLDEGTRVKVSVNGDNQLKKIREHVRDEWIPDQMGGTSKFVDPTDGQMQERGLWTNGECIHPKDQLQYFLDQGLSFDQSNEDRLHDLEKLKDIAITKFELDPAPED